MMSRFDKMYKIQSLNNFSLLSFLALILAIGLFTGPLINVLDAESDDADKLHAQSLAYQILQKNMHSSYREEPFEPEVDQPRMPASAEQSVEVEEGELGLAPNGGSYEFRLRRTHDEVRVEVWSGDSQGVRTSVRIPQSRL